MILREGSEVDEVCPALTLGFSSQTLGQALRSPSPCAERKARYGSVDTLGTQVGTWTSQSRDSKRELLDELMRRALLT